MNSFWTSRALPYLLCGAFMAVAAPAGAQAANAPGSGARPAAAAASPVAGRGTLDFLLHHRAELALTDRQVRTLEEMVRALEAHERQGSDRSGAGPDAGLATLDAVRAL